MKLIVAPLIVMILLTLFATLSGGNMDRDTQVDLDTSGVPTVEFNIWNAGTALVILLSAISVATIAGFNLLGSGLTTESQKLIFGGIVYIGIWLAFTVLSADYFFNHTITTMIYIVLTTVYIIGVALLISGGD